MSLDQSDYTELNRGEGGDKMATSTEGVVKVQAIHPIYQGDSSLLKTGETNRFPVQDKVFDDFSGTIGKDIDDTYVLTNPTGFSTIGFHLTIPVGAQVNFEGSFDEINWTSITFREIGGDGFRSHAHIDEDFIGSISALRAIRFRTTIAGSVDGSVVGRLAHPVSTIEGIEHGNPPHNIGVAIIRFGVNISGAVTDQVLYTPPATIHTMRFVVTGYALSTSGTGTIRIFDETNSSDNWIFAGDVKSNDQSVFSNHLFDPPFVSGALGNSVKVTTTDTAVVQGVMNGYLLCN